MPSARFRQDAKPASTSSVIAATTAAFEASERGRGAPRRSVCVVAAFDADEKGERYAGFLADMAASAGVTSERLLPPMACKDWNDVLTGRVDA